jgi:D-alanine-D-alanine ligase
MRIAVTYNLRRDDGEASAEFDTRETIDAIVAMLERLGHCAVPLDVTGSIPRVVAGLRWVRPDLIVNLAEGERGAFREAFYPALFEQLGVPHTGSSASVLALCLDKSLAKRVVAADRIAVPAGALVRARDAVPSVPLPALVKPNFEGSSKGITQTSVVTTREALAARISELLDRYSDGVLVEEFVGGIDVAVAWVDGIGLLPPIQYCYPTSGRFPIYDYALKNERAAEVAVEIPARIDPATARGLEDGARRVFAALGVEGFGRADFRVTPAGEVVFLEMNPLPALDDFYDAFAHLGRRTEELFEAIVAAASLPQARALPCSR